MITPDNVIVSCLGPREVRSPLKLATSPGQGIMKFLPDEARVRYQVEWVPGVEPKDDILFEKAGPREQIYFNPIDTRAAIVTCGGLCPGLNNVIRSLVLELYENYRVKDILGIQFGYQGLNPAFGHPPVHLNPMIVEDIHYNGGTLLGSSRGAQDPAAIVEYLEREQINLLFCVGGDGTQRGAHAIHEEARRQGYKIAVVGIPKTIDNDINYVWKTFGLATALEKTKEVIICAHVEAKGAPNGIGLVKVMGRDAGFIAAGATVASQEVNYTLIPEVPFELDGKSGFLNHLKTRLQSKGHAVIVVAEGAGMHLPDADRTERDASGNMRYADIGIYLQERIRAYFKSIGMVANLKYFDPSYTIRSVPANTEDSLLCDNFARYAVHAAMAGKTDMLVGYWHGVFVHVPIPLAVSGKKQISPESALWMGVLAATRQPVRFV
jgi:6-phosphofructokinase 1